MPPCVTSTTRWIFPDTGRRRERSGISAAILLHTSAASTSPESVCPRLAPASGYVTFYMEAQGAEVESIELPLDYPWDIVPDASLDTAGFENDIRHGIDYTRNAYWFAHERVGSKAKVHYGDIYALPKALGHFDYAVIAAVLLHVRDPLRVVEECAWLADSLVIVEMHFDDVPTTSRT